MKYLKQGSFEIGEIVSMPDDVLRVEIAVSCWLAPFTHCEPGDVFYWSPSEACGYYACCGYDPRSDATFLMTKEQLAANVTDGMFEAPETARIKELP